MDEPLVTGQERKLGYVSRFATLYRLNLGAGILHATNFIVTLVLITLYNERSLLAVLTTDFRPGIQFHGSYRLIWVELPFSAVTSLFHFYLALGGEKTTRYREYVFGKGRNPYRWIEYGITASLMTWGILQVAGATNILILVMVGIICNMALQYQGYLMEVMNPPKRQKTLWGPTMAGWLIFAGQWAIILTYFGDQVSKGSTPWFVYTIVIGELVQFSLFGLVQILQFTGRMSSYRSEISYIVLSYTSKLWTIWNLTIAMLTN